MTVCDMDNVDFNEDTIVLSHQEGENSAKDLDHFHDYSHPTDGNLGNVDQNM